LTIRHYAVLYPTSALISINQAMRVQECPTEAEVLLVLNEWRAQYPGKRVVYRREVETEERRA
jgi:hypothetical protein